MSGVMKLSPSLTHSHI